MRHAGVVLVVGVVFACIVAASSGQTAKPAAKPNGELAQFVQVIAEHPKALATLQKDPTLVSAPAFANRYPKVGQYLAEHPKVKDELKEQLKADPHFLDRITATGEGGGRQHP